MKYIKKKLYFSILVGLILGISFIFNTFLLNYENSIDNFKKDDERIFHFKNSEYTEVTPIIIAPSSSYDWDNASKESWCTGNGTKTNPYIIEGIKINGKNSSSCLEIRNSNVYFIIQNSSFYNSSTDSFAGGIKLDHTSNGLIRKNNCSNNNRNGISLYASNNNVIDGNTALNNSIFGIKLWHSNNNSIENINKLKDNTEGGIDVYAGDYNNITNNIITMNPSYGIRIYQESIKNKIYNNTIKNNGNSGIFSVQSNDNDIIYNRIVNNCLLGGSFSGAIHFLESNDNLFQNNNLTDNSKTGFYLMNSQNSEFISNRIINNSYRGIHISNEANESVFIDNVIKDNNYYGMELNEGNQLIIEGNELLNNGHDGSYNGIRLIDSNKSVIYNNLIHNSSLNGLNIIDGSWNEIFNNNISENGGNGIYFYANLNEMTKENIVYNNRIINNSDYGIRLRNPNGICELNNLSYNFIYNHTEGGIYLQDHCHNNSIHHNDIIMSKYRGIFLDQSNNNSIYENYIYESDDAGIYLLFSNSTEIYGNSILNHTNEAIGIMTSKENFFYLNQLKENDYGIRIHSGDYNLFYKNFFRKNNIHASDLSGNNYWNNSQIGNFWDNYTELGIGANDSDGDGIGEIPYDNNGVMDWLPLWDDYAPVINIISPVNNSKQTRNPPIINLNVEDLYLENIWYTLDGGLTNISFSSNGPINESIWQSVWNSVEEGEYINVTFYANDTIGRLSSKTIYLIKAIPNGISGFNLILILGVSLSVIYLTLKSNKNRIS
ncbi:MAG: hypothetical protein EU542_08090 [Promethearchaeota archaeon]|nr:MAG: hypothetical protein EU542_08090 [Candidatus Lokiarchaeota archaeon]